MGSRRQVVGGRIGRVLDVPDICEYAVRVEQVAASEAGPEKNSLVSGPEMLARDLSDVILRNLRTFRIFSPDELESNKLTAVLDVTKRDYQWPVPPHSDKITSQDVRVLEILSEHSLQAWLQGYLLTGRYGLFPSYEAFLTTATALQD